MTSLQAALAKNRRQEIWSNPQTPLKPGRQSNRESTLCHRIYKMWLVDWTRVLATSVCRSAHWKLLNAKHRSLQNTFAHFNSFPLLLPVRLLPITSKLSNGSSGLAKAATHKVEEKREVLGRPSPPHPSQTHTSTDLKEYTLHKLASADTHQIENTNDYNATFETFVYKSFWMCTE